jgi:hypothetical protein
MGDAASAPARIVVPTQALTPALRDAITGPAHLGASMVVWSDRGSQLIMYVGKLVVQSLDTALVVAVDTESTEFGTQPLIVRFAFGSPQDPTTLVVATDNTALGHPLIAARWGDLFRGVVWAALVRYAVAQAGTKGLVPTGWHVSSEGLTMHAEEPVSLPELARAHVRAANAEALRQAQGADEQAQGAGGAP